MRRYVPILKLLPALALLVFAGCAAATTKVGSARPEAATVRAITRRQSDSPTASPVASPPRPTAEQNLTAAVAPMIADSGGNVAVAVADLSTGATAAYDGSTEFVTASIVKVDILATLLYQLQQDGESVTSSDDQYQAQTMIENSDNDAASDLYADVGGSQAIDEANQVFGLTQTTVGTDGYWGLTTTTAADQIQLLRTVFTAPSPLSPESQSYLQGLMSQVESDQQWGVPAAADPGTPFMVKNGWLPNPTRWEINSIGEVVHDGQQLLIAVLSADNASEQAGIRKPSVNCDLGD